MSPIDALEKFILSWNKHDIRELSELFDDEFEYKINGKVRFNKKPQLRRYWATNMFRQLDLKIFTQFVDVAAQRVSCQFTAMFYNPTRLAMTSVSGKMSISLGETGKIISLVEDYAKVETKSALYALHIANSIFIEPIVRFFKPIFVGGHTILKGFTQAGLITLFVFGLAAMIYINFLHDQNRWLDDSFIQSIKPYTSYYFILLYIIKEVLPLVRSTIIPDIEVRKFAPPGDLKIMADELHSADRVSILSGDFSFLSDNSKLEETLRVLAFAGKLELFSYKTKEEVESEIKIKSKSYEIYLKLIDDGKIFFNCGVRAKCTIAEFDDIKKLLFRFSGDGASRNERHMGIVRRKENSQYLIEIVDRMFGSLRKVAQTASPTSNDS